MSKRISIETRIMEYARTAEPAAVEAVLRIAMAEVKLRVPATRPYHRKVAKDVPNEPHA